MTDRTTVVLADDHHIVCQGLRALLEAAPDLSVVGEAADGAAAIEMTARLAPDVLILDLVMSGHRYLSPPLSERAIDAYTSRAHAANSEPHEALTARGREVLRLAARGHSLQQIALELSISPRTAETHRANLMRKLGLHSQTDVVRYSIRHKILLTDD